VKKIFFGFDFRSGMGKPAELEILLRHSTPIVHYPDRFDPSPGNIEGDFRTSRIEGIVDQFSNCRCGPLDHLASSDLTGYGIPKDPYGGPSDFWFF
jgi:hypothetical protein